MNKKSIPFIFLSIIHFFLLVFNFKQHKQKTLLLLFSSIGIAYTFEYFVLNLLKLYQYYPRVFRNRWIDSVLGALLSQAVFVPIAAVTIALFRLGWKWQLGFTIFFGATERLFIKWKIFKNNKWNTLLTVSLLPLYFQIVKKWWEKLQEPHSSTVDALSILFCYWINYTNIYYFLLALRGKFFFRIGFLKDKYWEHFIIVPIYTLNLSVICTKDTLSEQPVPKWKTLLKLHLSDRLLTKQNILKATRQDIRLFIPVHFGFLLLGDYYDKLLRRVKVKTKDKCLH
jgi:hypothetical protein